jgi:hypothetical protein
MKVPDMRSHVGQHILRALSNTPENVGLKELVCFFFYDYCTLNFNTSTQGQQCASLWFLWPLWTTRVFYHHQSPCQRPSSLGDEVYLPAYLQVRICGDRLQEQTLPERSPQMCSLPSYSPS